MKKQSFLQGINDGVELFAKNITVLINSILLTLVYITGVGLTTICAKIVRKSFLKTKIDKTAKTYWEDLNLKTQPKEDYYRQF